jgi:peptide/nickel transport system permease protein
MSETTDPKSVPSTPPPVRKYTPVAHKSPSFWQNAMKRFRKNPLARFSYGILWFLILVALLADFLAYNKPFYAVYKGKTYFPIANDYLEMVGLYQWDAELIHADWRKLELESSVWPPVRYKPGDLDERNQQSASPFGKQRVTHWKNWHYLGTDQNGRDVLSGLIHGSRISLTVGLVSVGIAAFIGIILGAVAGYFGDTRVKISRAQLLLLLPGLVLAFFYAFTVRSTAISGGLSSGMLGGIIQFAFSIIIFGSILWLFTRIARLFEFIPMLAVKSNLWVDIVISRFIEIVISLPTLLLIITVAGIVEKGSIYMVMVVIGLTGWTGIARFTRGEMLRTRTQEYIQAARALGYSEWRIIFRHALPNSLAPVFVAIAFGMAGAILIESSLSFLGVGIPPDMVTWGSLLREARNDISAWWLAIFPGMAIFITVSIFNLLGESLRDALDPRILE